MQLNCCVKLLADDLAKKEANKAKREDRIAAEKEARKAAKSALEASKK